MHLMETKRKAFCAKYVQLSEHEWEWTHEQQVAMAKEVLRLDIVRLDLGDFIVRLLETCKDKKLVQEVKEYIEKAEREGYPENS